MFVQAKCYNSNPDLDCDGHLDQQRLEARPFAGAWAMAGSKHAVDPCDGLCDAGPKHGLLACNAGSQFTP